MTEKARAKARQEREHEQEEILPTSRTSAFHVEAQVTGRHIVLHHRRWQYLPCTKLKAPATTSTGTFVMDWFLGVLFLK